MRLNHNVKELVCPERRCKGMSKIWTVQEKINLFLLLGSFFMVFGRKRGDFGVKSR